MDWLWPADPPSDLAELLRPPAWHADAACKDHPTLTTSDFFVERGGDVRPALDVCSGCLVRTECLDDAMSDPLRVGASGGLGRDVWAVPPPPPQRCCLTRSS